MNKKKKQWIQLGIVVAVFLVLIIGVVVLSKMGILRKGSEDQAQTPTNDITSEEAVKEVVEADDSMETGETAIEDVLGAAAGYDEIYNQLVTYYQGMYSESTLSASGYDFLTSGDESADFESYEGEEYNIENVISFTEVQDHKEAGDVCKTDGEYAYLVRNDGFLRIMKLDGSNMEHKSIISEYQHEMESVMDLYVQGDRLVLITSYTEILDETMGLYQEGTLVYTYDITNREYPVLSGTVEVEGFYMGSALTETGLYVYTNCYKDGFIDENGELIAFDGLDTAAYVPSVNGAVLAAENVHIAKKISDSSYMVCASIDLTSPGEVKDAKAFLSVEAQYYTGENSMYVSFRNGIYDVKNTVIARVDMEDGMIVPAAACIVDGYVLGTMSLNENDGEFRVISTVSSDDGSVSNLYVFDEKMGIVTTVEDVTEGESIQAVRYLGDKAYIATYGENPIVVADITNRAAVSATSFAKPEYLDGLLYEFGEYQVIGLSYILNAESGMYEGIQLTMFDVTDTSNITAVHTVAITADSTPAISNFDSMYLDTEKGLIGFATEDWDDTYTNVENYYRLYSYSADAGFQSVLEARLGAGSGWYARGFVAGETFYVAEQDTGTIRSYDMANGYSQTGEMYY